MAVLTPLLSHARPAVRKRTISTIGTSLTYLAMPSNTNFLSLASFVPHLPEDDTQQFINSTILPGLAASGVPLERQRTTVHLVAAVARYLAPSLNDIVPGVLGGIAKDDEELREAGLQVRANKIYLATLIYLLGLGTPHSPLPRRNHTLPPRSHHSRYNLHQIRPQLRRR